MGRYRGTYLTERQVRVLEMRAGGMTLTQIAEALGVTPSTVSKILKSAEAAVERCRATISLYESIISPPIKVFAKAGSRLEDVVEEVYRKANEEGIKVRLGSLQLFEHLVRELGDAVRGGVLAEDAVIVVTRGGDVGVEGGAGQWFRRPSPTGSK